MIDMEIKQNKEDMEEKGITLDDAIKYCSDAGKYSASIDCKIINYKIRDWLTELKLYKDKERFNSVSTKKDLKSFSLEAAKAGKPVCTRDGRKARIICFDYKGDADAYPILALISTSNLSGVPTEIIANYTEDGSVNAKYNDVENDEDLMMLPEKKEGWVNVYKNGSLGTKVYKTRKEACDNASTRAIYVDTVKISWEE